jgi:hypothetical protein
MVSQAVECLLNKCEELSSNSRTTKNKQTNKQTQMNVNTEFVHPSLFAWFCHFLLWLLWVSNLLWFLLVFVTLRKMIIINHCTNLWFQLYWLSKQVFSMFITFCIPSYCLKFRLLLSIITFQLNSGMLCLFFWWIWNLNSGLQVCRCTSWATPPALGWFVLHIRTNYIILVAFYLYYV